MLWPSATGILPRCSRVLYPDRLVLLKFPEWIDAAERAWLAGNDEVAERLLLDGYRGAMADGTPDLEAVGILALARYAGHLDEASTASQFAQSVLQMPAADEQLRAWAKLVVWSSASTDTAESDMAALREQVAMASASVAHGPILASGAATSVALKMPDQARAWLELTEERQDAAPVRLMVLEASADLAFAQDRLDAATAAMQLALALAQREGWSRARARLELKFGTLVAPRLGDTKPMSWISRSAPDLLLVGTWRDRNALREALRAHGRRMADRAMGELASEPLRRLDHAVGAVRASALLTVQQLLQERCGSEDTSNWEQVSGIYWTWLDRVRALADEVSGVESDLSELVGEALVERDRTAEMVSALAELERVQEPGEFALEGARIAAAFVGAARAWVAERTEDGGLRVIASHPPGQKDPGPAWVQLLEEEAEPISESADRLPRRRASSGSTIAVPVEAQPFRGALLLEKGHPERRFRDDDRVLATLLGVQLAHGLARMRSRAAEVAAHTRMEATFEAIRDGVLAVDKQGRVRNANAAAARMLRMNDTPLVGARLSTIVAMQPLWRVLSSSPRLDSTVVRLPHGTLVVTSRPVDGEDQGMVATLVELGRAEQMARQITAARPRFTFDDIVGGSIVMSESIRLARLAAEVDANLLITGESGTGKEMFAQAVHTGGGRAHQPFVGINCAALPRDLLEAELFGYERGAFTGARQGGQVGKFEQVGEGTLLLDEIGDMPADMQAKLLRVLQERVVVRLGGTQERRVHARIISSTHRNLEEAVARSAFRLDLLFRLRVLHVHIPPLRDRTEDIHELAIHFLRSTAQGMHKDAREIGPAAMRKLEQHDWPGNVRELANVIEREVTMMPRDMLVLDSLRGPLAAEWPSEEAPSVRSWAVGAWQQQTSSPDLLAPPSQRSESLTRSTRRQDTTGDPTSFRNPSESWPQPPASKPMSEVERETYLRALEDHDGSVVEAAKSLGVSRSQFYARLKKWREEGLMPPSRRRW